MIWPFRSPAPEAPPVVTDPIDAPLLLLGPDDPWTMRDAFSGTLVTGSTGSGKTSGSGQAIRRAFLHSGLGGCILTVKDDEADTWIEDARLTGRSDSLVVLDDSARHRINYMKYEVARSGGNPAVLTENLIGLFADIMEAIDPRSGSRDDYWLKARDQLLRNSIDLALLAYGTVDLSLIYKIILQAPQNRNDLAQEDLADKYLTVRALVTANDVLQQPHCDEVTAHTIQMLNNYWLSEYPSLADRTRSSIVSTFTSAADLLNRGILWQLFSTETTLVPEMSREGVIFLLNLPVKLFHEAGVIAQVLFKYLWQRAMERSYHGDDPVPCFLWIDEYQNFVVQSDAMFQATARSKQVATVYLFQNLPALYMAMGGESAEHAVNALLGNLCTHIFHCNADNATNEWAAAKIAQTLQSRASLTAGRSQDDGSHGSVNVNQQRDFQVPPHTFTTLRNGGPRNDLTVEAIIFQTGRIWEMTRSNYIYTQFPQQP